MAQTISDFISEKLYNCLIEIEKVIGKENDLYKMIKQFYISDPPTRESKSVNHAELIKYSSIIVKVAKKNDKGYFYFEENEINAYLENSLNNPCQKLEPSVRAPFEIKIKRYLELFINTLCK